ncbi:hypothetical protein [Conchiformibius kuhniae]|uniref:Uncharacterized protein n=1 Tax=Conchiformibius kuhniae TaxID=211502 RepID=A0A8T9MWZ1_9NEIS|nr:hypothetical protein [Conchiformibius kuhniae]UOP04958.1 hypothetical protein LVJ77_01010 [Conchiformibius kuhniae]
MLSSYFVPEARARTGWGVSSFTYAAVFSAQIRTCRVENPCKVFNLVRIFALHLLEKPLPKQLMARLGICRRNTF